MQLNQDIVKKYFKENGIPYEEIDKEIIDLVYIFNKIGLKTEFCCIGHEEWSMPEIIFHKDIATDYVLDVANKLLLDNNKYHGVFYMWARSNQLFSRDKDNNYKRADKNDKDHLWCNWIYCLEFKYMDYKWDREKAIDKVVERLIEIYNINLEE